MNILEKIIYFILFIINKYTGFQICENLLSWFENRMIQKYVTPTVINPMEIPTIDANDLTDEKFIKLSNNYRDPVLIKGLMKNTDAVKKWDFDYLKKIIGDFKILTIKYVDEFEIDNVSFSDFADKLHDDRYINNNHTILAKFPQLFNDIESGFKFLLETLKSCNLYSVHIANLFIGYRKENKICAGSNMHCGGSGNFFCMLQGKKHWTMIDPKYSCILKGRVAKNGVHGQTLFDMEDSRLDVQPKIFQYLPRYEIILEPGDVLYNAPWWWHRIRNGDGLNIGMAIRNNKVTKLNLQNNLTFTLSGYIYLVYNTAVIEVYERYFGGNKHFTTSHSENKSVLYQIKDLIKKYPKSTKIEDILSSSLNK